MCSCEHVTLSQQLLIPCVLVCEHVTLSRQLLIPCVLVFAGVIELEEEQMENKTIFGFRDSKINNQDSDSDDE